MLYQPIFRQSLKQFEQRLSGLYIIAYVGLEYTGDYLITECCQTFGTDCISYVLYNIEVTC
jgi:hypothetical protein